MELVKLSKPHCGGCVSVGNLLKDLEVEYIDVNIYDDQDCQNVFKVSSEELIKHFELTSVPQLILYDDNKEIVGVVSGFNPPAIKALLEKM